MFGGLFSMASWILIFFICLVGECQPITIKVSSREECQVLSKHLTSKYPNWKEISYFDLVSPKCIHLKHDRIGTNK